MVARCGELPKLPPMLPSDSVPPSAPSESPPAVLAEVGVYRTAADGFDHGLVVLALGHAYWLEDAGDGFRLMVEPDAVEAVRRELECFDRESRAWPPPRPPDHPALRRVDLFTPLLWVLAELAAFHAQQGSAVWTRAGVLEPQGLFARGELWRPFTSLFLHADASHLVSNLLGGLLAFAAVVSTLGRLRGWLLIGVAAVAGNVIVAAVHRADGYQSLGASTAVFAALGLLTGRATRRAGRGKGWARWRGFFLPLATGLSVLALYGAGGWQVDVLAHIAGFAAGVTLGLFAGQSRPFAPAE